MALHLLNLTIASPVVATPTSPIPSKLKVDGIRISSSYWRSHNSKDGLGSFPPKNPASASNCFKAYSHVGSVTCKAVQGSPETSFGDQTVYQGIYGSWSVEPSDIQEVILYRSGLVTAAASFVLAASTAFFPDDSILGTIIKPNLDLLYVVGAGGLGLSLVLIHIYITTIKRTLQALWLLGVLGSLLTYTNLASGANETLVQYALDNPSAVWLVGPLFAALTGLVFKEGLCYGKLEAGLLTFIIPTALLGHLTNLMDDGVKHTLLASWMVLFVIFSGRKFTQPIKDDIGDKSVFMFNALPDDEKQALIEKLEGQKLQDKT